jgi:hypothetical protein
MSEYIALNHLKAVLILVGSNSCNYILIRG